MKTEEKLTETQKAIYNLVTSKEKVTVEELSKGTEFFTAGVGVQIAILRHLELIRGQKKGTKIYMSHGI